MVMPVRPLVVWRVLLLGFAVAYILSPRLQAWLPPLLPFLAAAAVEAQFFLAGLRSRGQRRPAPNRGPQERDLEKFGWASRTVPVQFGDAELVLRPGEMEPEEIAEWLEQHQEALAALAVLALVAGAFFLDTKAAHWQRLSATARAQTISLLDWQAARIAGHPVRVICDVGGHHVGYVQDADGLAEVGGHRAWLTPATCYQLHLIKQSGRAVGPSSGHAIAVLAHEAWHLRGQASEALANCFAYQSGVQVEEALGLTPATARQLMREQLADNPADYAATPQYIVPNGCHHGGNLDLHLDGPHFP